ncbi:MAG: CPBP family intramembrane metalloprotease [Methanoregula sp.]|nr:type II CAAX endopeptidase family protein [Methanoregula sp.]PKG31178.1 MAG: CPBP family intramembrane metalloprotease [Methanoregula sp.]
MEDTHAVTLKPDPKKTVVTFLILTVFFSGIFWYMTATTPLVKENAVILTVYAVGAMWGPTVAAIATRLIWQRNLAGFALGLGDLKWVAIGILLPVAAGLVMFGTAWLTGIAPFSLEGAAGVFAVSFLPAFMGAIAFNLFAAAGVEFGWRGFLVPELARFMGFTELALISAAIWTAWHFPLILFGSYHGAGSILYSLAVFIPSVMGAGIILAWLRLASGSVWVAILFHGFWNYFIQQFYPLLTTTTEAGQAMLGEFGWFCAAFYVALALVFWHFRDRLPTLPADRV